MLTIGCLTGCSGSSGSGGTFDALVASAHAAEGATFKAVYTTSSAGQTGTATFEQKPPTTLFTLGATTVISIGATIHICTEPGGVRTCHIQSGANPYAGLQLLFSPASAASAVQAYKGQAAGHQAGVTVSLSSATYAGQASTCVNATVNGKTTRFCVAKTSGVITSESNGDQNFQLTEYSTTVPDSDFATPGS